MYCVSLKTSGLTRILKSKIVDVETISEKLHNANFAPI